MARNTLIVRRADPRTLKWSELARFTLGRDGKVKAVYKDPKFEQEILHGVRIGPRTFKLGQGAAFMAALEKAYAASSLLEVVRSS
jgi:hypothetical protein